MRGKVFSIEEFSTFDGPGIRVTVFLKGCPLSCSWCHNPEGQSFETQFVRSPNGCSGCGLCEKVAIKNGDEIILTQESLQACKRNLIRVSGVEYEPQELANKLNAIADVLISSGGGITFSGGEPLAQIDFIEQVCALLNKKLTIAIQTSGFSTASVFNRALKISDYILMDIKIMDGELHRKFCGADNAIIKENYVSLVKSSKAFVTRIPLIPTVTDTLENITQIAKFLQENAVFYVELLPYNKFAGSKYALLLKDYRPAFDETKEVTPRLDVFKSYGIKAVIV